MATADKLQKLLETKAAIRQAIVNKGVEVGEDVVFADYSNKIAEISGGSDDFLALRTNNNTNYNSLFAFYEGESIEGFGIDTWDTSNVTNMNGMFQHCGSLTELDLSNFNTGNVRDISAIFVYCVSLETLDIRNFDLTRAFSYSYMIVECPKLHTLRLDNCSNDTIRKIIESDGFPTGLVDGETRKMWVSPKYVGDLTAPDGWEFVDCNTGEVIEIIPLYQPNMFRENRDIEEVSVMVTKEHDNLEHMFSGCENLRTINGINEWNTSNVTTMQGMFYNCRSLESLNLGDFKTSNVESMFDMFSECENLKELNLSDFEIIDGCMVDFMLKNCRRLHTLYLKGCNEDTIRKIIESVGFPIGRAEDYDETRKIYCLEKSVANLTAPDGWVFVDCKTGETIGEKPVVNYEKGMFSEKRDIEEVSVMVTSEHDDLSDMFQDCENLKTINGIKDWDTSHVVTMAGMFAGCKSLESLDLSSFNTSQVTNMIYMFLDCENLRELNLSNFDMCNISETWNTSDMFQECRKLHTLRLDDCSRETVERIINSSGLPTGPAEDYEGTRQIYVNPDNIGDLIAPDGWIFVDSDGNEIVPEIPTCEFCGEPGCDGSCQDDDWPTGGGAGGWPTGGGV